MTPRRAYARLMTQVLVTPERAAVLRERLKEKFAERRQPRRISR